MTSVDASEQSPVTARHRVRTPRFGPVLQQVAQALGAVVAAAVLENTCAPSTDLALRHEAKLWMPRHSVTE